MIGVIRHIRGSLTAKILLAFAVVVLVGIGGVAILANQRTTAEFESYLRGNQPIVGQQLADVCGALYGQTGSWNTIAQVLPELSLGPTQRLVVSDQAGRVVADTGGQWVGRSTSSLSLIDGQPITVNRQVVGMLYLLPPPGSFKDSPPAHPIDPGRLLGASRPELPLERLSREQSAFLDRVNQSLLLAAVGATAAALVLGVLLARRIIRPLRELTRGADRIAEGHFDERILVGGDDEVAHLAHAFNQMAESLQRTEQARRQIVADVTHELRTPLTIIGGTVQAIRDGMLPADDQSLTTIHEEVAALARLVADLRDLSLGDVGQFHVQRDAVDLSRVLEPVVAAFAAEAAARGVTLTVRIAPGLPWILGDEARLRQSVQNLVANALRHTPAGGQVTVDASAIADAVEIRVSDTGEGIAPEHLPRLFERFYRVDPSRTRRSGGSGLGLAIVEQIVRAHGGKVTAESEGLGHGATFTVRLPTMVPKASETLASTR